MRVRLPVLTVGVLVLTLSALSLPSLGAPLCRSTFISEASEGGGAENLSPLLRSMHQLETRLIRYEQLLDYADPVLKRQGSKLIRELAKLTEQVFTTGEMTEKQFEKLRTLTEKLALEENKLGDIAVAQLLDPLRLRRYLFTNEALKPDTAYYINELPGFGPTQIYFSKAAAEYFSRSGPQRDHFFPVLFKGPASRHADSGIKSLVGTGASSVAPDGRTWHLLELKKLLFEARVLIAYTEGEMHLYRVIENHHRVEYVMKENALKQFLEIHYPN